MVRALAAVAVGGLLLCSSQLARAAEPGVDIATAAESKSAASPRPKMVTYDRNLPWRVGLMVVGGSFLAISYVTPCAKLGGHWCIPYGGPIVAAVKYNKGWDANSDNEGDSMVSPVFAKTVVDTLLVGVTAVQLASTALIVTGALMPRRDVTEPLYSLRLNRKVALTPVAAPSVVGLVASGSF